jgi:chemotaxis protein methyltransferase CheR
MTWRMERDLDRDEFRRFHDLIYQIAGIHYPAEKLELLSNRIRKRLRATGTPSFDAYLNRIQQKGEAVEQQAFLDSITTNETYFFRCQRHFDFFRDWAVARHADPAHRNEPWRIWSAAASTGAEACTILIVLQQVLGIAFASARIELLGTDLSAQVLEEARRGTFRAYALAQTPPDVVKRHFTKNERDEFVFDRQLLRLVTFQRHNLMEPLVGQRPFDFVFLRNVMIYFDGPSRERVLQHAFAATKPGGYLIVGESESLLSVKHGFQYVKPSIFVRPAAAPAPKPARV